MTESRLPLNNGYRDARRMTEFVFAVTAVAVGSAIGTVVGGWLLVRLYKLD